MRNLIKKVIHPFLKVGTNLYFSKSRSYSYKGIKVIVKPEVFPPHLTLSTKILLDFINDIDLKDKKLLELGCGSGIISLFASHKGAIVTASDINKIALEAIDEITKKNGLKVKTINSDLFNELGNCYFDFIIINPPYYPKQPKNIKEQAWYCGENFEYFENLFLQLPDYITPNNQILMILSEDCDIQKIKNIASKNQLTLDCIQEKKIMQEKNFIFNFFLK